MAIPPHDHPHGLSRSATLPGTPRPGGRRPVIERLSRRVRALLGRPEPGGLRELPRQLQTVPLAESYLVAHAAGEHPRAGAAALTASQRALEADALGPAEIWAQRALWHFERAGMSLHATRAARRMGDVRLAAGDWRGSRAYYAEAISEARDIGAQREEGLAATGLGRAELQLGNVTAARRLAQAAIDLLERCGAPVSEVAAARALRGDERPVGEGRVA